MLRVVIRLYGRELETAPRRPATNSSRWFSIRMRRAAYGSITRRSILRIFRRAPEFNNSPSRSTLTFCRATTRGFAIAVCDTATLEHGLMVRQVHAAPLMADPLPQAWIGLPAVDFVPPITEPPDVWYLPGVEGRLKLPIATKHPVHIHLLVNMTPSSQLEGSITAMQRNMNAVIPILKTLSQLDLRNGRMEIALLDLTQPGASRSSRRVWDEAQLGPKCRRRLFWRSSQG